MKRNFRLSVIGFILFVLLFSFNAVAGFITQEPTSVSYMRESDKTNRPIYPGDLIYVSAYGWTRIGYSDFYFKDIGYRNRSEFEWFTNGLKDGAKIYPFPGKDFQGRPGQEFMIWEAPASPGEYLVKAKCEKTGRTGELKLLVVPPLTKSGVLQKCWRSSQLAVPVRMENHGKGEKVDFWQDEKGLHAAVQICGWAMENIRNYPKRVTFDPRTGRVSFEVSWFMGMNGGQKKTASAFYTGVFQATEIQGTLSFPDEKSCAGKAEVHLISEANSDCASFKLDQETSVESRSN